MPDPFDAVLKGVTSPALGLIAITPGPNRLSTDCRGLRVGGSAGNVTIIDGMGQTVTIPNVQVGEKIDVFVTHVLSNGTTATGITGLI